MCGVIPSVPHMPQTCDAETQGRQYIYLNALYLILRNFRSEHISLTSDSKKTDKDGRHIKI
jgi:hypothetical protein